MDVNDFGLVVTLLFLIVPTVFLVLLYVQTASRGEG